MNKKRILIFIDWYLPGFRAGGPIRSCANLVDHLKDEFEIAIITRDTDYMEKVPYPNVKSNEWNTLTDGTRVYYFSEEELNKRNIQKLIEQEEFDHVYLNGVFSKMFTLLPISILKTKHRDKIIVAARGMLAPSALKLKGFKKRTFLFFAKTFGFFKGILFHATNMDELNDIKNALGKDTFIKLAPNLPSKTIQVERKDRVKEKGKLRLIGIARIAPEKNILYALEVLAKTKANIVFDMYGPVYDEKYWVDCKKVIEKLPSNVKVNYKGVLDPHSVGEEISQYHFLFMPTRGENFGHIILQSLTAGTPVIISDQTPWKELASKRIGCDLPLDDQNNFILALEVSALLDQKEFDELSINSFAFAQKIVNDPKTVEQNKMLFR